METTESDRVHDGVADSLTQLLGHGFSCATSEPAPYRLDPLTTGADD